MSLLFKGFRAILYKEWIVLFRDPTTLFFMFFPPLIQIVAFGFALDMDVKHMRTVVFDEDRTRASREFVRQFENSQTFRITHEAGSADELSAAIRRGHAVVGIHIPPDFSRNLGAGRSAKVEVLIDGSSSSSALQALNTAVNLAFRSSSLRLMEKAGVPELPVEVRPQVLYNPDMKSPNFYVPGVIAIALQIATVFATAMSLVRERERGTIEQLLVSPLSRSGLMLGKILPYLAVSSTMGLVLLVILRWVFFIPIRGSLALLLASMIAFIFALLSLGLLVSTKAQSQMQALQMTMTLMLPSIFFSGFIFPIETMPWIFQAISAILPATYFIELMRAIVLRGAGFADFWLHLVILFAMGALLFLLSAGRFRQKVA
jgi:ABC-2 type transport system permease protein